QQRRPGDAQARAAIRLRHGDAKPTVGRASLMQPRRKLAALVVREPIVGVELLTELGDRLADPFLLRREGKIHQLATPLRRSSAISPSSKPSSTSTSRECSPSAGVPRRISPPRRPFAQTGNLA